MSDLHEYGFSIPDSVSDAGLSPHAFRLYGHLKRLSDNGDYRPRSTRELAQACDMSTGAISNARAELVAAGLMEPIPTAGYVYLLHADTGHYKIGFSRDPQKRLKDLDVGPMNITLIHSIPADDMANAELRLHQMLEAKRWKGEWFALNEDDVHFIKALKKYVSGNFFTE